jgi:hypoxanthine phosphoribosyltransferase
MPSSTQSMKATNENFTRVAAVGRGGVFAAAIHCRSRRGARQGR